MMSVADTWERRSQRPAQVCSKTWGRVREDRTLDPIGQGEPSPKEQRKGDPRNWSPRQHLRGRNVGAVSQRRKGRNGCARQLRRTGLGERVVKRSVIPLSQGNQGEDLQESRGEFPQMSTQNQEEGRHDVETRKRPGRKTMHIRGHANAGAGGEERASATRARVKKFLPRGPSSINRKTDTSGIGTGGSALLMGPWGI